MKNFIKLALALVCCCCYQNVEATGVEVANYPVGLNQIQVATDNTDQPVFFNVNIKGRNDGRPAIMFSDSYFGIQGWACYQDLTFADYYTIAVDPLGNGGSSKNVPTAMDGVLGLPGYSYAQQAALMNVLFQKLNIQGEIIWVSIDTVCSVGIHYAHDFASSDYPLAKLAMIESSPQGVVSNDPCTLTFITTAGAAGLLESYSLYGICATNCGLLADSFLTTDNPEYADTMLNASVQYTSQTTYAILERYWTQTFLEDVTPLMPEINIPTINFYGTTSNIDPVSLPSCILTACQYCRSNPSTAPGNCGSCGASLILPFTNNPRFIIYPGHGTCLNLSAFVRFSRDLSDFITGLDQACTPCPLIFNPGPCPGNCVTPPTEAAPAA